MPTKRKPTQAAQAALSAMLSIPKELIIDQFVTGPMSTEAVTAASMLFKKALIERALGGELSHHLGYPPGGAKPCGGDDRRNGASGKSGSAECPVAGDLTSRAQSPKHCSRAST